MVVLYRIGSTLREIFGEGLWVSYFIGHRTKLNKVKVLVSLKSECMHHFIEMTKIRQEV